MKHEHMDLGEDAWVDYYSDYYSKTDSDSVLKDYATSLLGNIAILWCLKNP